MKLTTILHYEKFYAQCTILFEFLAPATASTFASVAAAAGLKPTTGEKPTTAIKKVLPKPVNFEPPGSEGEPKNPWTLVKKCHSKSGQNFSPDDGSQVGSQTLHSLRVLFLSCTALFLHYDSDGKEVK